MGLPGTDFARAAKDVQRTKDHEQIHVDHARAWHDNNKAAIEKAFNTPYQFDTKVEAQAAIDVRLNIWNRKWEAFYAGEIDHTNPGWEGYVQPPLEKK